MKWLFVNPVKAGGWGGMENWMVELCDGLPTQGDVCLALGRPASRWPEVCAERRIPFLPFRYAGDLAVWNIFRLRAVCRRHRPDVACVKGFRQARLVRLADPRVAILVKLPLPDELTDALTDRLTYQACVDRVLVDNHAARRAFLRHPWVLPGKIAAVHNGVAAAAVPDAARRAAWRATLGVPSDTVVFAAAGNLIPRKRLEDAIRAFASARERTGSILVVIGDGPERPALEAAARRAAPDAVRFVGWREDARDLLAIADIFIHPSANEGLSNVILEAMAAAVPVIATDVAGASEMIEHGGNGFLVQCGAVQDMAGHARALLGDAALRRRMGDAARERVEAGFTLSAMVAGVRAVAAEAVAARQAIHTPARRLRNGTHWTCRPDFTLGPEALRFWQTPAAALVQESDRSQVYRIDRQPPLFIKCFRPRSTGAVLRYGLRPPQARSCFRTAQRIRLRGGDVVPHLAAAWERRGLLVRRSTLLTGVVPGATAVDAWLSARTHDLAARRAFCAALARWLAHLHGSGIAPHDLKAANILTAAGVNGTQAFFLLDLDNCRVSSFSVRPHDVHRNLHQFFRSFQRVASPREMLRFAAEYRGARRIGRRAFRVLLDAVERRLLRRGSGYAALAAALSSPAPASVPQGRDA